MGDQGASLWWKQQAHLFGVLQKTTPFRKSSGSDRLFFTYFEDEQDFEFSEWDKDNNRLKQNRLFERRVFKSPEGIFPWIETELFNEVANIAQKTNMSVRQASITFTTFNTFDDKNARPWIYDPVFGIYQEY